jgi:hypothetical protein
MLTLPDPKHEAFATLRASGHDVASAYLHAGFSVKNVKSRARKLVRNPDIQARIDHLKSCLPRITELQAHHCPSLRLMPETRHEMLVWLWQVMNGTRAVKPAQMRAATLYCRMRGWHLAKLLPDEDPSTSTSIPATTAEPSASTSPTPSPVETITQHEQAILAMINVENIAHERTGMPLPQQKVFKFQSLMADQAHTCCRSTPIGLPIPEPIPELAQPPVPGSPQPIAPSPSSLPVRHVLPVRPVLASSPPSTPVSHDYQTAKSTIQKSPSQPALQQRLTLNSSPTPHFFVSSKADPVTASPSFLLPLAACSV